MERLTLTVRAKSLELSLDKIKDILTLKNRRSLTCKVAYERLNQKVQDIEEKMALLNV